MQRRGFTLIELMIVIAIIAIIAAIAIPGLLQSQRAANERNASASLKSIATAEIDFRSNDRDQNRVNDFWTGNVWGLYSIQTSTDDSSWQPCGKYIDMSLAAADNFAASDIKGSGTGWYWQIDDATKPTAGPKAGYWYYALDSDASSGSAVTYKVDTDGTGKLVHNASSFGFGCYPDTLGAGRSLFMINEGATLIRLPLNESVRDGSSFPPDKNPKKTNNVDPSIWPDDTTLKKFSRTD